ncbi:MAG: thiol-disulfide oxidoreductase DCC family protein [Solirubrobacteraceae bacterium]
MASWHLIAPTGERCSRGAAVPPLLRLLPAGRLPAVRFALFPKIIDRGYRWVADHRSQISTWIPARSTPANALLGASSSARPTHSHDACFGGEGQSPGGLIDATALLPSLAERHG